MIKSKVTITLPSLGTLLWESFRCIHISLSSASNAPRCTHCQSVMFQWHEWIQWVSWS